jgi:hypothetical protein
MKRNENYCVVTRVLGAGVLEKTDRNECVLICQASEKKGIATTLLRLREKCYSVTTAQGGSGRRQSRSSTAFVKEQEGLICKPGVPKRWTKLLGD